MEKETEPKILEALEEVEIYDDRVYNLTINFTNCTITNIHIEQYGKPVNPPPPPGGG